MLNAALKSVTADAEQVLASTEMPKSGLCQTKAVTAPSMKASITHGRPVKMA
jgi:hypothetical protein